MPAEVPSRKERKRQRCHLVIVSAALRLFAQKGYHGVSMQEIAAAAEVATGTLYNFFPSKEELFFEVLASSAEQGLGLILPVLEGPGDEWQRLACFIRAHEQVVREHSLALQLYLLDSRGRYLPGPKIEAKRKEIDDRVLSRLSQVIAAGVAKGLLNEVDPVIAAKSLVATLDSMILVAPQIDDLREELKGVETLFFRALVKPSGDRRDA
ncbi:MAG: TetR/AcrR family transcriptional regulator [Phycisphaerales bacterium]